MPQDRTRRWSESGDMPTLALLGLLSFFEVGVGAPGGMTFGVGAHEGRWRAFGEVGGLTAGMAGMMSAQASLQRDLTDWPRTAISAGLTASMLGFLAGSDEAVSGTIRSIGPAVSVRRAVTGRTDLALDVGALGGNCRGDCPSGPLVMIELTARVIVKF